MPHRHLLPRRRGQGDGGSGPPRAGQPHLLFIDAGLDVYGVAGTSLPGGLLQGAPGLGRGARLGIAPLPGHIERPAGLSNFRSQTACQDQTHAPHHRPDFSVHGSPHLGISRRRALEKNYFPGGLRKGALLLGNSGKGNEGPPSCLLSAAPIQAHPPGLQPK